MLASSLSLSCRPSWWPHTESKRRRNRCQTCVYFLLMELLGFWAVPTVTASVTSAYLSSSLTESIFRRVGPKILVSQLGLVISIFRYFWRLATSRRHLHCHPHEPFLVCTPSRRELLIAPIHEGIWLLTYLTYLAILLLAASVMFAAAAYIIHKSAMNSWFE